MTALNARAFANGEPVTAPQAISQRQEAAEVDQGSSIDPSIGVAVGFGLGVVAWIAIALIVLSPLAQILMLGAIGAFLIGKSLTERLIG